MDRFFSPLTPFLTAICLNGNNSSNENHKCFSQISSDCFQYARWSLCVWSCVRASLCVSGWVVVVFMGCIIGALLFSTCLCSLLWNMKPNHCWTSELTAGHTHTHHQLICVYCLSFKKYELTQKHKQQKCQYEFLTQSFFILLVHLKPQISSGQALKTTAVLIHGNLRTAVSAAVQHCGFHWFVNKPRRRIKAPVWFLRAVPGS